MLCVLRPWMNPTSAFQAGIRATPASTLLMCPEPRAWQQTMVPEVMAGKKVLIAAHGNSLRALVKHLEGMSEDEVVGLNIPTGIPLVYELGDDFKVRGKRPLGDPDRIRKATEAVRRQGRAAT